MSNIGHTHGPWTARANGAQWVVDAGRKQRVASINTALMGQEANARLIAAAPDLLEAAREFVRQMDHMARIAHYDLSGNRGYQGALAAIAKAEGRE